MYVKHLEIVSYYIKLQVRHIWIPEFSPTLWSLDSGFNLACTCRWPGQWCEKYSCPALAIEIVKGCRICYPKICLFGIGVISVDYLEKQQIQEELWKQSYPFIRKIYFKKGACSRNRAITRDNFYSGRLICKARQLLIIKYLLFSTSHELPYFPLKPQPLSISLAQMVYKPQPFECHIFCGAPIHIIKI